MRRGPNEGAGSITTRACTHSARHLGQQRGAAHVPVAQLGELSTSGQKLPNIVSIALVNQWLSAYLIINKKVALVETEGFHLHMQLPDLLSNIMVTSHFSQLTF